ncbi:MAG: hypothetical protein JO290_02855 [Sphingomonadaceae bacterium]|nr:hypothetical protein [Sphingomonadaceae bacterium]
MACDCIALLDAKLVEHNTRIKLPLIITPDLPVLPMIETEQVESGMGKKRAIGLFATYCPFCGDKLSEVQR